MQAVSPTIPISRRHLCPDLAVQVVPQIAVILYLLLRNGKEEEEKGKQTARELPPFVRADPFVSHA